MRGEYALTDAVEHMAGSHRQMLTAQVLMVDEQRKLAETQSKTEISVAALAQQMNKLSVKSEETRGKLDALIHMWDDRIKERGGAAPAS